MTVIITFWCVFVVRLSDVVAITKAFTLAFQLFMWIFELLFSNSVLCLLYMSLNPSQLCYFKWFETNKCDKFANMTEWTNSLIYCLFYVFITVHLIPFNTTCVYFLNKYLPDFYLFFLAHVGQIHHTFSQIVAVVCFLLMFFLLFFG